MNNETQASAPKGGICWHYPILILVVGGSMASCFLQTKPSDQKTKPQEWRESRGPVVPHDSFPRDCTICHAKGSWHEIRSDFVFDHAKETGTPLNGAHGMAQCLRCHNDRGSVATFAKRGCTGCHEDIHRGRLGINCTTCHSENDWNPTGVYAVHAKTRFPLQGVHAGVACVRCHPSSEAGQFLGADPRCEACHRQDAIGATTFNHAAQNALSNCQNCHGQTSWADAHFSHAGITSGCSRCHTPDYNNAKNPNHITSNFPMNCEACHNTNHWRPANFNHAGITSGCVTCHAKDFGPAQHQAGIPANTCEACHTTSTWIFNHNLRSGFPVNHGDVNGTCSKCHQNLATPKMFMCIECHEHNNQADLANKHNGENGYVYANTNCLQCHQNGRGGKRIQPLKLKPKPKK